MNEGEIGWLNINHPSTKLRANGKMREKMWVICGLCCTHCKYVIDDSAVFIIGYPPVVIYQIFITNKVREYLKLLYNYK